MSCYSVFGITAVRSEVEATTDNWLQSLIMFLSCLHACEEARKSGISPRMPILRISRLRTGLVMGQVLVRQASRLSNSRLVSVPTGETPVVPHPVSDPLPGLARFSILS